MQVGRKGYLLDSKADTWKFGYIDMKLSGSDPVFKPLSQALVDHIYVWWQTTRPKDNQRK